MRAPALCADRACRASSVTQEVDFRYAVPRLSRSLAARLREHAGMTNTEVNMAGEIIC